MANMDATAKVTNSRRELTLYELVIPDLKQMEATGNFNRDVLLWLQDAYVSRAMKENTGELLAFHRETSREDVSEEERWKRKAGFLEKITLDTYKTAKSEGKGVDLSQYVDAAKTLFESESVLYAGQLGELADFIKKSMEAGVKPDIERFARDAYVSMSRMSLAIQNLEGMKSNGKAQEMAKMMKAGIEQIAFVAVTQPGLPLQVGRKVLEAADHMGQNVKKYIQFVEPYKLSAPSWDFRPASRSGPSPDSGPSI